MLVPVSPVIDRLAPPAFIHTVFSQCFQAFLSPPAIIERLPVLNQPVRHYSPAAERATTAAPVV